MLARTFYQFLDFNASGKFAAVELETAGDPFSQGYLFWGQAVVLGVVVWIVVGERPAGRVDSPR